MDRHRLPNRRAHETLEFEFRGLSYTAGIGRYENGALAEVFIECSKGQSQLAADARDAAVCLSIALQYGVPAEAIRSAWMRIVLGDPAIGPLEHERMAELDNHLRAGIWFAPHWRRIRLFDERVARLHALGTRP